MKKILMMVMSFCLFHSTIACNEKQEFYDDFIDENQERVGDNSLIFGGTLSDIDNNIYATIIINGKEWMTENLKVTRLNDGSPILYVPHSDNSTWNEQGINQQSAYTVYYDNNYSNIETNITNFGLLYNWFAVESNKLAPQGWRVATEKDWIELEEWLIVNGYNYDGTRSGNKISKSLADNSLWNNSNNEGAIGNKNNYPSKNNITGFSATPSGRRVTDGSYMGGGRLCYWWNATENDATTAWYRYLFCNDDYLHNNARFLESDGLSVRCIRDIQ